MQLFYSPQGSIHNMLSVYNSFAHFNLVVVIIKQLIFSFLLHPGTFEVLYLNQLSRSPQLSHGVEIPVFPHYTVRNLRSLPKETKQVNRERVVEDKNFNVKAIYRTAGGGGVDKKSGGFFTLWYLIPFFLFFSSLR